MRQLPTLICAALALTACSSGSPTVAATPSPSTSTTSAASPTSASSTPAPPTPGVLAYGRTATTELYAVTAYAVSTTKAAKAPGATEGNVWVSVDAKFCLSKSGPASGVSLSWDPWSLVGADGSSTFPAAPSTYRGFPLPAYPFASDKVTAPGSCSRGWVVFEVPKGTKVGGVLYQPSNGDTVRWG